MNSSDMQRAARSLFVDARAAETEMGGYFYQVSPNSPIQFQRLDGVESATLDGVAVGTDNCSFVQPAVEHPLGAVLGLVHTHQAPENVSTHCRFGNCDLIPRNSQFGGGSDVDWKKATTQGLPEYTIDANAIWRLDPNTGVGAHASNPNQWTRQGNACATHATF